MLCSFRQAKRNLPRSKPPPTENRPYIVDFLNPDGSLFAHAVIVLGGKEIIIMSLSDSNTIYGVMKKIDRD